MKALSYLLLTTMKNRIKQLKNNPAQLILAIFFVAMLGLVVFTSTLPTERVHAARPLSELGAIILALYTMIFLAISVKGLSSGASFYSMADVNLLFATPIKKQRILFYGLVRQLGTSLLLGFFILFQYGWLNEQYNVSIFGLFVICIGYCLTVFCAQLTAMVIYSLTSGNEARQKAIKFILYALGIAAVLAIALPVLKAWNSSDWPMKEFYSDARFGAAVSAADSPVLALFPVAGWLKAAVIGCIGGQVASIFAGLAGIAAYVIILVTVIIKMRSDFYEDVLKATEISFTAVTASKQGKMREATPAKVKVGKTGIGGGSGPGVFFYKHMLENRRSGLFLLDSTTMLFAVISIIFAFFMKGDGIIPIFVFATYMQLFSTSTGRWLRELILPYIYLIPADPFKKLIGVCRENIFKSAIESVVVMVPVGLIVSASPLDILVCVLARFSFSLLFMAGNIVVERLFGEIVSKVLILGVFIIAMAILALPGVIVGILLGTAFGAAAAMPVIAAWNVGISALIIFLCRDILNYAELNNK